MFGTVNIYYPQEDLPNLRPLTKKSCEVHLGEGAAVTTLAFITGLINNLKNP